MIGAGTRLWALVSLLVLVALPAQTQGQGSAPAQPPSPQTIVQQIDALPWQKSPAVGRIGSIAQISLDGGLRFLDAAASSKFIQLNGNPPSKNSYVLVPAQYAWFAVFTFDDTGHVKDDDKLKSDELLTMLKEQNEEGIKERKKLNLPSLRLVGWMIEPHYDLETRRLEWGTKLISDGGEELTNYTIRILGRSGVMQVILVSDPQHLQEDIKQLRTALRGFDFVEGQRYSEYRSGDKVAEYGLAGLIVGGAAAVAAKSGALKGFVKLIGVGVIAALVAVGAFFRKFFGRKT